VLKYGTTLTRLEPFRLFSLGNLATTCIWGMIWTVCKLTWTWESNTTNWNEIDDQRINYFAVEKASSISHRMADQFSTSSVISWTLVKAADNWLNILWFSALFRYKIQSKMNQWKDDIAQSATSYIPRHINSTELIFWPAIILLLTNTAKISHSIQ